MLKHYFLRAQTMYILGGYLLVMLPADDKYTISHQSLKVRVTNSLNTFSSEDMFHRDETRPKRM